MSIADKYTTLNTEKIPAVHEAGKKREYDRFWDLYQESGRKTQYSFAFAGNGWNDETFKPKYDIVVKSSLQHMFSGARISDLVESLNAAGVTMDTSAVTSFSYLIQDNSYITRLPVINTTSASDLSYFLYNCTALKTIDEIVLKSNGSQKFTNYSFRLSALEEIRFSGTIGQNGFNVQWSTKLSHDSLMSIINALADKSADTSGTTWKVTLGADNIAKLTTEETTLAESKGWTLA